jgi:hypothetical protein
MVKSNAISSVSVQNDDLGIGIYGQRRAIESF